MNRSRLMRRAWRLYRRASRGLTFCRRRFAGALRRAWSAAPRRLERTAESLGASIEAVAPWVFALVAAVYALAYALAFDTIEARTLDCPAGEVRAEDGACVPFAYYDEDAQQARDLCREWREKAPRQCAALDSTESTFTVHGVLYALD